MKATMPISNLLSIKQGSFNLMMRYLTRQRCKRSFMLFYIKLVFISIIGNSQLNGIRFFIKILALVIMLEGKELLKNRWVVDS